MNPRSRGTEEALLAANQVILPLLRAAKRLTKVYEAYTRRPLRVATLYSSGDKRVHVVVVNTPLDRALVVSIYSSVQSTRPASPQQVKRRLARLARITARVLSGAPADIIYVYVSKARLTKAAYRAARSLGAFVALAGDKARSLVAHFLSLRLRGLLKKTAGRVWGPLALLALTFYVASSTLSGKNLDTELFTRLLDGALRRRT